MAYGYCGMGFGNYGIGMIAWSLFLIIGIVAAFYFGRCSGGSCHGGMRK